MIVRQGEEIIQAAAERLYRGADGTLAPHPTGLVVQSNDEYHSAPGISKSHLDAISGRSPRHYWQRYLNPDRLPDDQSHALMIGSAVHSAILEPDLFPTEYMPAPEDAPSRPTRRQIEAKKPSSGTVNAIAWWQAFDAEHAGKIIIKADDYAMCMGMRDSVHAHPIAAGLLRGGQAEQSFYAIDNATGELIKCRTDYLHDSGAMIVDLKTTEDASPAGFGKSSANFRYPIQPAWYNRVLDAAYGEHPETWVFLAVEKEPPYAVGIYYVEPDLLARAELAAERDFLRIVEARSTGEWPDYGWEPQPLILPSWAKL